MIEKICEYCGKLFSDYASRNKKFCCYECSRKAKCTLKSKVCQNCNKLFKPRTKNSKYCCKKCADEGYVRKNPTSYETVCQCCNKVFVTIPSESAKFCSRECWKKCCKDLLIGKNVGTFEERFGEKRANEIKNKISIAMSSDTSKQKMYETKRKNKTFTTSKPEDIVYKCLSSRFKGVIRNYKTELYPFLCDFYIPELNLYIEYQGHWTHGKHPFENTREDNKVIRKWKDKNTKFYKNAIEVWTVRDIKKRNTAKNNNLNWLEFFTLSEFNEWFENL